MMHRVFFDANVIIEWMNKSASHNKVSSECIESTILTSGTLLVSPTTLAIVYYFISKQLKNDSLVKQKTKEAFELFSFTTEDASTVHECFNSDFTDLEDALQYFSAAHSNADAIVTFNFSDYRSAKIPVFHPAHYLTLFHAE